MRLYECGIHGAADFENHPTCVVCKQILKRIEEQKGVHERTREELGNRPKLREEIYWPSNNSHEGRVIENVGHKPTFFSTKKAFRDHLKINNLREAG